MESLQTWTNSETEGNINYSIEDSKSFDYKTRITERLEGKNSEEEVEIVAKENVKKFKQFLESTRYTIN